jgi:geranylgeranyl reductase family protein
MRSPTPYDVVVVGAGPAGIAAAIRAHDAGLEVVVVDKARFPRDKACGDGLTTAALRRLERMGLDLDALPSCTLVSEAVLVSPSGRRVTLPLPRDGAYTAVVPRLELDTALVGLARQRGIEVREGAALAGADPGDHDDDDGKVVLRLDGGDELHARWVVAADGHYSPTRRAVGAGGEPDLGTWHAVRQYFSGVPAGRLWVMFEPDLLPGYAWVFPLPGGRANVGFGMLRRPSVGGKQLKALWPDLLARPGLRAALGDAAHAEGPHRAWPIPSALDASRLAHGVVLFAGDAASVVDPLTGEGIAQALETGELAADAITRGGSRADIRRSYREAVMHQLGTDLRFADMLQRVMRSPARARAVVRAVSLTPWTRRNFARWMFEDYPRAVVATPDRWSRGMFTRAGAYRTESGVTSRE